MSCEGVVLRKAARREAVDGTKPGVIASATLGTGPILERNLSGLCLMLDKSVTQRSLTATLGLEAQTASRF